MNWRILVVVVRDDLTSTDELLEKIRNLLPERSAWVEGRAFEGQVYSRRYWEHLSRTICRQLFDKFTE